MDLCKYTIVALSTRFQYKCMHRFIFAINIYNLIEIKHFLEAFILIASRLIVLLNVVYEEAKFTRFDEIIKVEEN